MDFSPPKPRRESEPALPMINVVFLLLVFFLMSAQIVTPPPVDVTPPVTERGETAQTDLRLHISAGAVTAFADRQGEDVWPALAAIDDPAEAMLLIRADAALPAQELAGVLTRLSDLGFRNIQLAAVPR